MRFGVTLVVVGGGSLWIYGFSGGGFVGFCVLEVVVETVGLLVFFFFWVVAG